MFYIMQKTVNGIKYPRYFKDYLNAKKAIDEDIQNMPKNYVVIEHVSSSRYDHEKQMVDFIIYLRVKDGINHYLEIQYTIIDGHFED